jgi:hypothetical protein
VSGELQRWRTAGEFFSGFICNFLLFAKFKPFQPMKRTFPSDTQHRFRGNLRHYHRTNAQAQRSWEDWVNGSPSEAKNSRNWLKIVGIALSGIVLTAILVGLFVELK